VYSTECKSKKLKELSMNDNQDIDNKFKDSVLEVIEIYAPFYQAVDQSSFQILNETTSRIYSFIFTTVKKLLLRP